MGWIEGGGGDGGVSRAVLLSCRLPLHDDGLRLDQTEQPARGRMSRGCLSR